MKPLRDAVELTRELIRFNTINPPGEERPCAQFLADLLQEAGFETSLRDFGPGRANLIATLRGTANVSPLVLTGHIDVVPLGARAWTRDPFKGEIDGDRLYGRGASDMKSGVAAFVCAAIAMAAEAQRPHLMLVITAGEETGCSGASALVAEGKLGSAGAMVVAEPTANALYVGHKGALWLNAVTTGVTAHGSMPERGDNAIYKAARVIRNLETFEFNAPPHPALGRPTLSVNTVRGGLNINSVPDRTEIGVDIRTIPAVDHAALREALQRRVGDDASIDAFLDVSGIWTSPEVPWVKRAVRITAEVTGETRAPGTATYFSDASVLTPAMGQPHTVVLGPGEPGQAHQTDEWCSIRRINEAVAIYTRLMRDWLQCPTHQPEEDRK